jgi:P-type Ca2+ transporter type 2C
VLVTTGRKSVNSSASANKKEDRVVNVIRSGKTIQLSVYDVLVGDVVHLEPGDLVPVDGVFITGHLVKCDESSEPATGESDALKKTPASEVFNRIAAGEDARKLDPFILSGSKVLEGVGTFLVTNVGEHSGFGMTMMALHED